MSMHTRALRRRRLLGLLTAATGALLAACAGQSPDAGRLVAWPARDQWPPEFYQAAAGTQAAYRFAVSPTGQAVLRWQPCYCGCEADGHVSNLDCFVDEVRADGSVVLDPMSFG
jgi:hypothetical protein